ncbi:MAG: alpha/beta hydrolase [Clostridia bacterium]|nr:alpha/beta hydrolase [Clostridia bacterium]
MYTERKLLSEDGKYYVDIFVQHESPEIKLSHLRPMVVVLPGGGYMMTSDREAEPIALEYLAAGFNAAVVRYHVNRDAVWPNPQVDVSEALKYIRANAGRFLTDPNKIALCGFSAGGHLTASMGVHWDDPEIQKRSGCLNGENRPDALVLGYAVINDRPLFYNPDSMGALLRNYAGTPEYDKMYEYVCCEKYVKKEKTPPAFMFSTWSDHCVPIHNTLDFAAALDKENIPAEVHIYQNGEHGLGLADFRTYCVPANLCPDAVEWIKLSCNWLWNLFGRGV